MDNIFKKAKEKLQNIAKPTPQPQQMRYVPQQINDITVLMLDGTYETYSKYFHITDGVNACLCPGDTRYHTWLRCQSIIDGINSGKQPVAVLIKEAEKRGITYCFRCGLYDEEERLERESEDDEEDEEDEEDDDFDEDDDI